MQEIFGRIQARIGNPPRSFSFFERLHNKITPPQWIPYTGSYLIKIYHNQKETFQNGQLGLAAIIQANDKIFESGVDNLPAAIVYSTHNYYIADPTKLTDIAQQLFALKQDEQPNTTPEIATLQKALQNEQSALYNIPVPTSMTNGRIVRFTTIMLHRSHLPTGKLEQDTLPILVLPETDGGAIILPAKYWEDPQAFSPSS